MYGLVILPGLSEDGPRLHGGGGEAHCVSGARVRTITQGVDLSGVGLPCICASVQGGANSDDTLSVCLSREVWICFVGALFGGTECEMGCRFGSLKVLDLLWSRAGGAFHLSVVELFREQVFGASSRRLRKGRVLPVGAFL